MLVPLMIVVLKDGIPIFNKKKGEAETNLPFCAIGSLNVSHMFCKSQDVLLQLTYTNDGIIVWKEFENCVLLIAKGISEKVLKNLLELTFNAMVFAVGLNDLKNYKHTERLKRDLSKICSPVIDVLLETVDTELHSYSDCILCSENTEILDRLLDFSEQLGSAFSFVLIRQKIAVASLQWWELNQIDRILLISLLNSSKSAQMDVPVYLPHKSPNIAYRLVSVPLLQGVNICVLCGSEPPYSDIENVAQQIWKNDLELLELAEQSYPRNFPSTLQLDGGILGILLINKTHQKYVISRNIQQSSSGKRNVSGTHRLDILRTFFHQAVDVIDDYLSENNQQLDSEADNNRTIKSTESYWCSDYHKCHAYRHDDNLICILYTASTHTHTMRLITQKTLKMILSEKDICWQ